MRYKRKNILALEMSSLPVFFQSLIRDGLTFLELNPAKMKSVQILSSRNIVFLGLSGDQSAAAVAAKHSREIRITVEEVKYAMKLDFVAPETPNKTISETLQKYLAVPFPGKLGEISSPELLLV